MEINFTAKIWSILKGSNMQSKKVVRSSNLELLRILCILAIIAVHVVGQAGVYDYSTFPKSLFYNSISSLPRVACGVFIIISAWFSVDKKFHFKKVIHVWLTVICYTLPLTLFCVKKYNADSINLYKALLPIQGNDLWFASYFMVLLLISPVLNLIIQKTSQVFFRWILFILLCLVCIFPTVTAGYGLFSDMAWSLTFLYLLTGYIKKYGFIPKLKHTIPTFFVVWILIVLGNSYVSYNTTSNIYPLRILKYYFTTYSAGMQTLPNLVMAYSAFFIFYNIKIKPSKIINTLASASLGVYCAHQVPVWSNYLWENIFFSHYHVENLSDISRAIYTIAVILSVWIVGTVIELIRIPIVNYLVEGRNYCINFCNKIDTLANAEFDQSQLDVPSVNSYKFYAKILVTIVLFLTVAKFISLDHYWYLATTDHDLVSDVELNLSGNLEYDGTAITGTLCVENMGINIKDMSIGDYPLNLALNIVDADGNIVVYDIEHTPIMKEGILKTNDTVLINISLQNMTKYINDGYGIEYVIVQEAVGWLNDTAVNFYF